MSIEQIPAKQYVVIFPSAESAQENWPQGIAQDPAEAKFDSDTRKVASLSPEMADSLVKAGAKVYENYKVSIPEGEMESRLQTSGDVDAKLKESIYVHGADKLHAAGIMGNSSASAPTMVTIDTGIAPHKDLQTDKRGLKFYDVFDKTEEAWNDKQTHGTHCSGIMMAQGGVTGMAPEAKFIGIKVLDDSGSGTLASVLAGIDQAIVYFKAGHRPMVCNMSLGGGATEVANDALVAKVKEAADLGIYFAIAAGNAGPRSNTIGTPGTTIHPRVIPVAAFDTRNTVPQSDDGITSFSSRGGDKVNLGQDSLRMTGMGADGFQVYSTINTDTYAKYSGTSMAAPHVTGALGLLLDLAYKMAAEGNLAVAPEEVNVAEMLRLSGNDHADINADTEGKYGEMQVDKAAELLIKTYGKKGTAYDAEAVFERDLAGRPLGIDYEASAEANATRARALEAEARICFISNNLGRVVELKLEAVKDLTDAELYKALALKAKRDAVRDVA